MGTHRYFFASAPWRTDMNKWIARALNPEKTQPPPAPDSGTGEFSMPKPPPNSPEPPKSHPVPEPRRQTARPPQQDRSPHAFLKSPERLDRIRMGLKAESLLRHHGLGRGGDETDSEGRLVREGGGWWECPVGDHTYHAGSCMRWTPTLMWHDFHERYFCFNCHHSWSFEEMKTLLTTSNREPKERP